MIVVNSTRDSYICKKGNPKTAETKDFLDSLINEN